MLWKYDTSSFVLNFRFRFFCWEITLPFGAPIFPFPTDPNDSCYRKGPCLSQKVTRQSPEHTICTCHHLPFILNRNQSISVLRTVYLPHWSITYKLSWAKWGPQGLTNYCTFSLLAFLHFHLAIEELILSCFPAELETNRLLCICNMV